MPGAVRRDIQVAVDQYLNIYQEHKKLKEQLDGLREVIQPYMDEHELPFIEATDGRGRVEVSHQERPVMNARYTTYDAAEIAQLLQPSLRKKCIVEVVDKEKLEALCKLGEAPSSVLERKITKPITNFAARFTRA